MKNLFISYKQDLMGDFFRRDKVLMGDLLIERLLDRVIFLPIEPDELRRLRLRYLRPLLDLERVRLLDLDLVTDLLRLLLLDLRRLLLLDDLRFLLDIESSESDPLERSLDRFFSRSFCLRCLIFSVR